MTERAPNEPLGEQTVWQGTPSQAMNAPTYIILGLGLIIATVGLLYLRSVTLPSTTGNGLSARSVYPWIVVAFWVLGGVGAVVSYLKVSTTKYVLTTERLRVTTGVLSTVTQDLELRRVRDMVIVRPLWARMMGLGDVQVMSADASTPRVVLTAIRDPDGVQTKLRQAVQTQWARFGVRQMEID